MDMKKIAYIFYFFQFLGNSRTGIIKYFVIFFGLTILFSDRQITKPRQNLVEIKHLQFAKMSNKFEIYQLQANVNQQTQNNVQCTNIQSTFRKK